MSASPSAQRLLRYNAALTGILKAGTVATTATGGIISNIDMPLLVPLEVNLTGERAVTAAQTT